MVRSRGETLPSDGETSPSDDETAQSTVLAVPGSDDAGSSRLLQELRPSRALLVRSGRGRAGGESSQRG